jgi:hypothetical protein
LKTSVEHGAENKPLIGVVARQISPYTRQEQAGEEPGQSANRFRGLAGVIG